MTEMSSWSPGAEATEMQRVATCEQFTESAAIALALEGYLDAKDVELMLDPFADVFGTGGRQG